MSYQIQVCPDFKQYDYKPRGGCHEFYRCKEHEFIAEGPSETGKTLAACWKIHMMALTYPGLNGAIARKIQRSVYGTVLLTFGRVIKNADVIPYGGEKPEKYIYGNGSQIWVGGLDDPDKLLSSERDFIYVNQTEECSLDDWEKMTTRTTGRGAVMPYTMTFGDCNPGGHQHWIRQRAAEGKLRLIKTIHQDNPTIYTDDGLLTEHGQRVMETLSGLSGIRRKRLFEGIWATAEGVVYDGFAYETHVKSKEHKENQYWALALDEGYTNPAVILLIGVDGDGRLHIEREFYQTGILQSSVCETAATWANDTEHPTQIAIVDQSAAGLIADLKNRGLDAQGHKGRVLDGITIVQDLLRVAKDGKPRLTVDPSCVNTINEFESYVWKPGKDEPIKENDHALDALRYFAHWLYGDTPVQRKVIYHPVRM